MSTSNLFESSYDFVRCPFCPKEAEYATYYLAKHLRDWHKVISSHELARAIIEGRYTPNWEMVEDVVL